MKNYIKLLSVALLVSGATQVSAMDAGIYAEIKKQGRPVSTFTGKDYLDIVGQAPKGTVLSALKSRLQALADLDPTAVKVAAAAPARAPAPVLPGAPVVDPDVAALVAAGLTQPAATFVAFVDKAPVGAAVTGLPPVDFTDGNAGAIAATGTAYGPAVTALAAIPGFSTLKNGNKIYFVAALKSLIDARADLGNAIGESATTGALTAASGVFAADGALITQADAKAAPAKVLANIFEKLYNASGVQAATARAWLDAAALPAAVKTELEKEATWTAILAAAR